MDIDLLWALGGWFLVPDCMAAFRTTTISETSTKSHPFLFFLALLFILLILVHPAHQSRPSAMDSSNITPSQRLLLSSDSSPTSTVNLHPKQAHASSSPSSSSSAASSRREFKAGAHEVPSGPNPISNR
ncbi:hypothetical protein PVL29_009113 [Vitis rotundifolia]|uniref:Uncharacterized protein n=1 Tax=Vitis rotundifolia TaxID=103349 RepID=A0AA38ZXL7_VITRO|nr:hypothetical protein PVL29_009113 [Vitis rotundifolia]